MVRIIRVPSGHRVSLADYVAAWKRVKAMPPDQDVWGWTWYPVPARDVLRDLRRGTQDRINQRGGLTLREPDPARVRRHLAARISHSCRWCGTSLGRYVSEHFRFCDPDCRGAFYS